MKKLYLYFDGVYKPALTFDAAIMEDVYSWCRILAMSFTIDGYCFRPYNDYPLQNEPPHLEIWDEQKFFKILKNI